MRGKMSENLYEILGVQKSATKAEIKKAFREKAKKFHPDAGGDAEKFKKISEAYEILGDDEKRKNYDNFGAKNANFGGGGNSGFSGFSGFSGNFSGADFGDFSDIFSSFFGGGKTQKKTGAARGADLEVEVELDFNEAIRGCEKIFSSQNFEPCDACDGRGGSGEKKCDACDGRGKISQKFRRLFRKIQKISKLI